MNMPWNLPYLIIIFVFIALVFFQLYSVKYKKSIVLKRAILIYAFFIMLMGLWMLFSATGGLF